MLQSDTMFKRKFVTGNSAATQWSSAPLAPPLATLVKVIGGVGLGQVSMSVVSFGGGIFRSS